MVAQIVRSCLAADIDTAYTSMKVLPFYPSTENNEFAYASYIDDDFAEVVPEYRK